MNFASELYRDFWLQIEVTDSVQLNHAFRYEGAWPRGRDAVCPDA
ncbi:MULTISPECIES: hypothetical protein [unclassified Roseovarius]